MTERPYTDLEVFRRLLRYARPYRCHLAGIFALSLAQTPLALLTPIPLKIGVDSFLGSEPLPAFLELLLPAAATRSEGRILATAAALVVVFALLKQLVGLGSWLLNTYTGEKLVLGFRAHLFRHTQRLSLGYHDARGTVDTLYRIQYDASAVRSLAISGVFPFVTASLTLGGMIWVTAVLDWQLALVALTVAPILFVLARAARSRLGRRWHAVKRVESSAMAAAQETLSALRVVKAFGGEDRETERWRRRAGRGLKGHLEIAALSGGFDSLTGLTLAAGTATVLGIGLLHTRSGILTLGELLLIMGYLGQLYGPLKTLSNHLTGLQSTLASGRRLLELLDQVPDVREKPRARPLERARGTFELDDVSFSYDGGQKVLEGISLEVAAGRRIGIAGQTGAGKTTLVNLLPRFYDPSGGRILLDGVDLRDYRLADLREQFAIVLQEPMLFSTTLGENIAYGRAGAGEEEVVAAAKAANAHDFITALPDGYDTRVGERGMRLSGGERQRIALARAFLKDAPILIMDEPTSSVDLETEGKIMEATERLMEGRTTFLIAHRLSTLESCDLLLVLDGGRLVRSESEVSATVRAALAAGGLEAEAEARAEAPVP